MKGLGFDHSVEEIIRRWDMAKDHQCDHTLMAEDQGHPVGVLSVHIAPLLFYPEPMARITTLVVDPGNRRRGIGRSLVEAAICLAQEYGCDTIELTTGLTRREAHEFYRAIGFEDSALRMSRRL